MSNNGGTPQDLDELAKVLKDRLGTVVDWHLYTKGDIHDYLAQKFGRAYLKYSSDKNVMAALEEVFRDCTIQAWQRKQTKGDQS